MSDDAGYIEFLESELLRLSKINRKLEEENDTFLQWCDDENLLIVRTEDEDIRSPSAIMAAYIERLEESQERTRQKKKHAKRLQILRAKQKRDELVQAMIEERREEQTGQKKQKN